MGPKRVSSTEMYIRNYHKYLGNVRLILSDDMSLYYLVTFCCLEFDKEFHHLSVADPPFCVRICQVVCQVVSLQPSWPFISLSATASIQ